MSAADLQSPIIDRLESEIIILRGSLNLSRQRAEDAEADLAEAKRELANETARADDADRELWQLQQEVAAAQAKIDADHEQEYQAYLAEQAAPPPALSPEMQALSERVAAALIGPPDTLDEALARTPRKRKKVIPLDAA